MIESPKFKRAEIRENTSTKEVALVIELSADPDQAEIDAIKEYLKDLIKKGQVAELIIDTNGKTPIGFFQLLKNTSIANLIRQSCNHLTLIGDKTNMAKVLVTRAINWFKQDAISFVNYTTIDTSNIMDIERKQVSEIAQEYILQKKGIHYTGPFSNVLINFLASE